MSKGSVFFVSAKALKNSSFVFTVTLQGVLGHPDSPDHADVERERLLRLCQSAQELLLRLHRRVANLHNLVPDGPSGVRGLGHPLLDLQIAEAEGDPQGAAIDELVDGNRGFD